MTLKGATSRWWAWSSVCVLAACGLLVAGDRGFPLAPEGGYGNVIAYERLPESCPASAWLQRRAMRDAVGRAAQGASASAGEAIRTIKDSYPSFAAVSVNTARDEVVFTDESLFQVLVYDRRENTSREVVASTPKRVIAGDSTDIEFQSGVYVDPKTGEIYAVNNDTRDTTIVFGAGANGDVKPSRAIQTPHGTFGIAVADSHDEILLTIQHEAALVTYKKAAGSADSPIRLLQGGRTKLADPHGVAYDPKDDVIFVANFGSWSRRMDAEGRRPEKGKANWPLGREAAVPGSGTIGGPSITVYRRTASGDEAPLRTIEGTASQLDWPTGVAFDPDLRELYVTNDTDHSVLVFDGHADGNAAPKRVLKGPRTGLANPTGVAVDLKNRELWVANFGGHSGTVYDLTASGDAPPLRTIRNAPAGSPSLMIGNPGALALDTKRGEILVPN